MGAQDVEMLGRMYGTAVPQAYYDRLGIPGAFQFDRGFRGRESILEAASRGQDGLNAAFETAAFARRVTGQFNVPVVLAAYQDSPEVLPYDRDQVQAQFFDGPNPTGTIPEFYAEASGGRIQMSGFVFDWARSGLTQAQVAGGSSGLGAGSRIAEYIAGTVAQLDSQAVDWGMFDNDGPDGVPNSGDDDGFVDVLAVLHPTDGAECGGNRNDDRIWSHRWSLSPQIGSPYVTNTASASGGFVKIDSYTVQPVRACGGNTINQIGVFTHELGHGFGLPDLYAVGGDHAAVGQWGLMATGSWGCPGGFDPSRPCQMGAWSRVALGWADVITLPFGADHGTIAVDPALSGGSVYRVNTGTDDYFLLENRQPEGFDGSLPDGLGGLLVWQIDPNVTSARWPSNTINSVREQQGVRVVQADGREQLWRVGAGRGDAGDLFPGVDDVTEFHAGSNPASFTNDGVATGVALLSIDASTSTIRTRVLARYHTLRLFADGLPAGAGWVRVDEGSLLRSGDQLTSAPFQRHLIEAVAGVELGPGLRIGFDAWADSGERSRTVSTGETDTELRATYAGREVQLEVAMQSDQPGVTPGLLVTEPMGVDGWYAENSSVTIEALARTGFAFADWAGSLSGSPNPATITLTGPLQATAIFDVTFEATQVSAVVQAEGGQDLEVVFESENGNAPILWSLESGTLPDGLTLQPGGRIVGVPLEPGTFPLGVRVVDGIGLEGRVDFTLEVAALSLGADVVARAFTGAGQGPSVGQGRYLDAQGNGNGVFDLGDLRAFLQGPPATVAEAPAPGVAWVEDGAGEAVVVLTGTVQSDGVLRFAVPAVRLRSNAAREGGRR